MVMVKDGQAGRRFIAYFRVSTDRQGRSGLGLEAQREVVARHVASVGGKLVAEFKEVESGRKNDRPELAAALAACRRHRAVLVIAKLDRLARNVHFISGLMESGVEFIAADAPDKDRFMLHVRAAFAEEEAHKISERTKAALAAARARGVKLGGLRRDANSLRPYAKQGGVASGVARREKAADYAAELAPIIAELDPNGALSLGKLANALTERKVPRPRGGTVWSTAQVHRLKARIKG